MSSIVDFDCLTLDELERLAFQTNNVLALAIFARAEAWANQCYEDGLEDGAGNQEAAQKAEAV